MWGKCTGSKIKDVNNPLNVNKLYNGKMIVKTN